MAATKIVIAQDSVDLFSATLGPCLSRMRAYPKRRSNERGLTKAIAKGNAPGTPGYPVDDEVNKATVIGRAKL